MPKHNYSCSLTLSGEPSLYHTWDLEITAEITPEDHSHPASTSSETVEITEITYYGNGKRFKNIINIDTMLLQSPQLLCAIYEDWKNA